MSSTKRPIQDVKDSLSRRTRNHNLLRVAGTVADAETVTIAGVTFEADVRSTEHITAGNVRIALFAAASLIAATGTLTVTANPANNETVVIGGQTYTFKTALTASTTANEVLIGADASASLDNLIAAINKGTGGGTLYGSATVANASVSAAAGAGDTVTLTALVKGAAGNAITTTETLSNGSFGGGTLSSGADTSAADFTTALTTAINNSGTGLSALRLSANAVLVEDCTESGTVAKACSETLATSNNTWAAANTYGASPLEGIPGQAMISRAAIAAEVTLGFFCTPLNFTPAHVIVQVRSSTGLLKAITGLITISGRNVVITADGATNIAAGDIVTVLASE